MNDDGKRCSPLELLFAMRDSTLTPYQRVLLAIYRSYEGEDGWSYPGDARVAEHMGLESRRQLQRHRTPLLDSGVLVQRRRGRGKAAYRVVLDVAEQAAHAREREEKRVRRDTKRPIKETTMGSEASHQEAPMGHIPAHREASSDVPSKALRCPIEHIAPRVDGTSDGSAVREGSCRTERSEVRHGVSGPSLVPSHEGASERGREGGDSPAPSGPRPDDDGFFRCGCGAEVGGPRILCADCRNGGAP